jgi:thiamine-monophosphate kinase
MCPNTQKPGSESELVEMFKALFKPEFPPSDLLLGIGDDAAVFEPGVDPETKFVITTDMLVEDVHFRREFHSFYDIGWRTAVANISDIAAMGAHPRYGVASLASPHDMTTEDIMEFARGLNDAMVAFESYVIGGDLTRSTDKMSTSLTIIGETTGRILTRTGAQLGDVVAVTGSLGVSGAGLAVLQADNPLIGEELREVVVNKHLRPVPRVWAGQVCAGTEGIHCMMDISDGLGIDIGRLCRASRTGVRIFEEQIPIADETRKIAEILNRDSLEFVNSGEDFELMVVGDPQAVEGLMHFLSNHPYTLPLTIVGEILDEPLGMHLARIDGSVVNPSELGWDHFRTREQGNG